MAIRPLDQQFAKPKAERVKVLIRRIGSIRYPSGVSRYYALDLQTTLEAGALLASLCLGSSLLEVTIRKLVLHNAKKVARPGLDLQAHLEAQRDIGFPDLIDGLSGSGLFDVKDAGLAKDFYRRVRIPVLHGLARRFVDHHSDETSGLVREILGTKDSVTTRDLEEVLEEDALKQMETLAGVLERNLTRADS